jgi:hypothetical protein
MLPKELRLAIERGDFRFVPPAFSGPIGPRTLNTRLEIALGLAAALEGGAGARTGAELGSAVLDADGPREVRRLLQRSDFAARLESRVGSPPWDELRALYGFAGERWRAHGQFPSARVAACLAADVTWMPYAHGILLGRDHAPSTLAIDLGTLASTLLAWAMQDHPAVALALAAALDTGDAEPPLGLPSLAGLVVEIARPHIGGSFAETREHEALAGAAGRVASELTRLMLRGRTPLFTSAELTGIMLEELRAGQLLAGVEISDPVVEFERAAAALVFDNLAGKVGVERTIATLDELSDGMRMHLA